MTQKQAKRVHLRTRFISITAVLGSLLILGALSNFNQSRKISDKAFSQLTSVLEQSILIHEIRTNINDANRYLNLYLLVSDQDMNKIQFSQKITAALKNYKQLKKNSGQLNTDHSHTMKQIIDLIQQLDNEARRLFIIRVDPSQQYPSMNIAYTQMQPSGKTVTGGLFIAVNELLTNQQFNSNAEVYQLFFQTQQLWSAMVAEFRIYMANRMGSYDPQGFQQHEDNIENFYTRLIQNIAQLKILDRKNILDFEGSNAIDDILGAIIKWKTGFNQVKAIHNSEYWRTDTLIMHDKIMPLIAQLLSRLEKLERSLEDHDMLIITYLTDVADNHNTILFSIIFLFIFYLAATLVSVEQLLFKPIAAIANALKSDDMSDNALQKYATTTETRILIDAFEKMHQRIVSRQKELEYQALHDDLTHLPNRKMLKQQLSHYLSFYNPNRNKLALIILALNKFREVNDTLGHHIGDQLLIEIGERFNKFLRNNDIFVRLGGDEFALLLPDSNAIQAINIAEEINESLELAFKISEYELQIGVSIGIASYPRDGEDLHTLLKHADVAMYAAKKNNQNYSLYYSEQDKNSVNRLSLVIHLKKAIKRNTLELYFQPQVSFGSDKISGAEALLRWNHPEFGRVNTEYIIELAEQAGLIDDLTEWIIDQSISFCRDCHKSGFQLNVSINLSAQNIKNQKICMIVRDCLKEYNVASQYITLEITESAVMSDLERSLEVLNVFAEMGTPISIDDFGTGFSSLAYLKKFPVNELKIDKSFIMEIDSNFDDDVIVRSTIELGHNLGLSIVAEGIENIDVYNHLKSLGCDTAQGYLLSKPLEKQLFFDWLKQHSEQDMMISLEQDSKVTP